MSSLDEKELIDLIFSIQPLMLNYIEYCPHFLIPHNFHRSLLTQFKNDLSKSFIAKISNLVPLQMIL